MQKIKIKIYFQLKLILKFHSMNLVILSLFCFMRKSICEFLFEVFERLDSNSNNFIKILTFDLYSFRAIHYQNLHYDFILSRINDLLFVPRLFYTKEYLQDDASNSIKGKFPFPLKLNTFSEYHVRMPSKLFDCIIGVLFKKNDLVLLLENRNQGVEATLFEKGEMETFHLMEKPQIFVKKMHLILQSTLSSYSVVKLLKNKANKNVGNNLMKANMFYFERRGFNSSLKRTNQSYAFKPIGSHNMEELAGRVFQMIMLNNFTILKDLNLYGAMQVRSQYPIIFIMTDNLSPANDWIKCQDCNDLNSLLDYIIIYPFRASEVN